MMRSLWSAASGMKGEQKQMDVLSHNIANVNTYGAKPQRAEFQDLSFPLLPVFLPRVIFRLQIMLLI